MSKTWRLLLLIAGTFVFAVLALVVANSQDQPAMPGMDHSKMDMPQGSDQSDVQEMGYTVDYPFEKNPQDVWSLERQMPGHQHGD